MKIGIVEAMILPMFAAAVLPAVPVPVSSAGKREYKLLNSEHRWWNSRALCRSSSLKKNRKRSLERLLQERDDCMSFCKRRLYETVELLENWFGPFYLLVVIFGKSMKSIEGEVCMIVVGASMTYY